MRNFVQRGETVPLVSPTGGVKSGDFIIVGAIGGVCNHDAVAGDTVELTLSGVFDLPKTSAAIAAGVKVYWNDTAEAVTTAASGNSLIGAAIEAAASDAATARVRLNGTTI